jgi:serine/threonine protein kinase
MFSQPETILAKRFRVRAQIGYATLGWLYRAVDEKDGKEVALRMVLGVRGVEAARERLAALIERLSGVSHPGLAKVYDCDISDGQLWFASEWLGDPSLEHATAKTGGALDGAVVARIGIAVASALGAAHANGITHRGLKTRTIFVGNDRVRAAECGVAAAILADAPMLANTPGSTSPEQILNGVVDQRADIYSLGCCLFSAAVGRPPFSGGAGAQMVAAQVGFRAPRAREMNPAVAEGLELILLKAMATHPNDRFHSMGDFSSALSQWREITSDSRQ